MNKYVKWGVIIFEIILIISLVQGIGKSRRARERVDSLVAVRNELGEERRELLKRLEYVQGEDYLERIAREELGLAKEGEVVVIMPEIDGRVGVEGELGDQIEEKANWRKWLDVFGVE